MAQVISKDGMPVWKDSDGRLLVTDAETAQMKGFTPATEEEAAEQRKINTQNRDYGSAGQQLQAAGETVLRTGTFGLVEGFDENAKDRAETFQRVNPLAADVTQLAAEVGVDIGIGALTGGVAAGASRAARAAQAGLALAGDAAGGLAGEANRSFVEGRELRPWEAMAFGAVGGLAGRGTAFGLGKALQKITKKGGKEALSQIANAADVPESLAQAEKRALYAELPDVYSKIDNAGDSLDEIAAMARHSDGIVRNASDDMATALRHQDDMITEAASLKSKRSRIKVEENEIPQIEAVGEVLAKGESKLDSIFEAAEGTDAEKFIKKFAKKYQESAMAVIDAPDARKRFIAMDNHKRLIQKTHVSVSRSMQLSPEGQLKYGGLKEALEDLNGDTIRLLEREDLWGQGAKYQEAINNQFHQSINAENYIKHPLARVTGQDFDARRIVEFDGDAMGSFLRKEQQTSVAREQFDIYMKAQREKVNILEEHGMLTPDQAKATRKSLDQVDNSITRSKRAIDAKSQFETRKARVKAEAPEESGQVLELLSAAVGRKLPFGNVVGPMLGTVRDVGAKLAYQAAEAAVGRGSALARAGVATRNRLIDRAVKGTLDRFQGDYSNPEDAYLSKSTFIRDAFRNPGKWADTLAEDVSWLATIDPKLHQEVIIRQSRALRYLAENLPPAIGVSMQRPNGIPPDRNSIRQFAQIYNAVVYPETVLQDLILGKAVPAQINAIRDVHPELYTSLQMSILDLLSNSSEPIPTNRKIMLSTLFELTGAAGALYTTEVGSLVDSEPEAPQSSKSVEPVDARPASLKTLSTGVTRGK